MDIIEETGVLRSPYFVDNILQYCLDYPYEKVIYHDGFKLCLTNDRLYEFSTGATCVALGEVKGKITPEKLYGVFLQKLAMYETTLGELVIKYNNSHNINNLWLISFLPI